LNKQKILRPNSWGQLNQELFSESFNKAFGRYRSPFAFRGVSKLSYNLETSLQRLGHSAERLPKVESAILRNFKKYAYRYKVENNWHWLSMAQHFGLPTRLLDWTYSPYVALHFATEDMEYMKEDGVIWCINFVEAHKLLPAMLREALKLNDSGLFTIDVLDKNLPDPHSWELVEGKGKSFVLFFEPPSLDDRIINQVALFSMMPDVNLSLDSWLKDHPAMYKEIIISARLKWEIRDKLDQANINERILFPGLDGLSKWLKRWYSPKI